MNLAAAQRPWRTWAWKMRRVRRKNQVVLKVEGVAGRGMHRNKTLARLLSSAWHSPVSLPIRRQSDRRISRRTMELHALQQGGIDLYRDVPV